MSDASLTNSLLLDINQQLGGIRSQIGGIEQQLKSGSEKHKEFQQQLDMIDRRTDIIEDKTVKIENVLTPDDQPSLTTRIRTLEIFHGKMGAVMIGAGAVISLISSGILWIISHWTQVRDFFRL